MTIIAPSILAADFGHLQDEVASIEPYCEWLQLDVMDGHFVPNLSFGAPVCKCIKTKLLLDAHLMVANPADRITEFAAIGCGNITFHAEAVQSTNDRRALMSSIRATGATAGIALNPATPLSAIDDVVSEVDLVLIMSVEPGFGGQSFMPEVLEKVKELRARHPDLMIQMDGGIDTKTAPLARKAGANNLVAGSAIFKAKNRKEAIEMIRG
ncbi:MAG: ribulose-phosphate 3-epimerase [Candidatus Peribacteraceae bacterium]|nr:ribulose-phosphate 3-epimerase [Candidatus Peribacteraceae bacterium]